MKKIFYLSLIMALVLSCSQEELPVQNQELSSTSLKGKKADITIMPSGDATGVTDANAIEVALAALPSGGVLLLESGTFYINRTVVAPESFNGAMLGRGVNETQIVGVGNTALPFNVADPVIPTSFNNYPNEAIFLFYNPEELVEVQKLSITIPVDFVADGDFTRGRLFSFVTTIMRDNDADTKFTNLKLTGKNLNYPDNEASPAVAVLVIGDLRSFPTLISGGSHIVSNCEISKIAVPPAAFSGLKNASIFYNDNICFDVRQTQFQYMDGCDITVKNNNITAYDISALNFTQQGIPISGETNTVEIKNNIVSSTGFLVIEVGPSAEANFEVEIKDNQLEYKGGGTFGFPDLAVIGIFAGNENAVIKDNTILGSNAAYGIFQQSDFGVFKDNDLTNFTPNQFDYALFGSNNQLEGVGNSTVDDQGSNNSIKN